MLYLIESKTEFVKDWSTGLRTSSTIVGFDFGTQSVLDWQKITCYFISSEGNIFYLTPLLPRKFSITNAFFGKLTEAYTISPT